MKLKLKSSQKHKKRYILVRAKRKEDIEKAIFEGIGLIGMAKAMPIFVSEKKGNFIFAVNREKIDDIRASFELSKQDISVLSVSGTLKGIDRRYRKL